MYNHKELNFGFVILCSESNLGLLKCTVNSIKAKYETNPIVCATDESAKINILKEMNEICPTYKGKSTFSSLINVGMKKAKAEWNFIICAGASVKWKMDEKFSLFIESEKDVLFPIANRKINFVEATLNGLFINKKTWDEVGEMNNEGNFEEIKLYWAIKAIEKGVKFKAIAGSKIC